MLVDRPLRPLLCTALLPLLLLYSSASANSTGGKLNKIKTKLASAHHNLGMLMKYACAGLHC
jgi:hypothetical protein